MKALLSTLKVWKEKKLVKRREKIIIKNKLLEKEQILLDKQIQLVDREIEAFVEIIHALEQKRVPKKYRNLIAELSKKGQLVETKEEVLALIAEFDPKEMKNTQNKV